MKAESLVIVDQHATVNTFPGLVHTARHTTKVDCTRSRRANPALNWVAVLRSLLAWYAREGTGARQRSETKLSAGRQAPKVRPVIGVKS